MANSQLALVIRGINSLEFGRIAQEFFRVTLNYKKVVVVATIGLVQAGLSCLRITAVAMVVVVVVVAGIEVVRGRSTTGSGSAGGSATVTTVGVDFTACCIARTFVASA